MKFTPDKLNHFVNDKNFKTAHLYEIEMAVLQILSETNLVGTNKIIVDKIDKCFVGMTLSFGYYDDDNNVWGVTLRTVTSMNPLLAQITLDTTVPITKYQYIVETLYNSAPLPIIYTEFGTFKHRLEFNHAFMGTFNGKILLTDFDIPVIINGERTVFNHLTDTTNIQVGPMIYAPFPIGHREVNVETSGKMNTAEINISNVNDEIGDIVFAHDSLRRREVKIRTIFLENGVTASIGHLKQLVFNYVMPSRTQSGQPLINENEGFFDCIYGNNSDCSTDFTGRVNNVSIDLQVNINAIAATDDTENTFIPSRLYSRTHCPFVYKSWRCRFRTGMKLNAALTSNAMTLDVFSVDKFYYLKDLRQSADDNSNETYVLQIDSEQILVDKFLTASTKSNEEIRQLKHDNPTAYNALITTFQLRVKQRGYNSTVAVAHDESAVVDIIWCRKTEHDCALHAHDAYFGAFPSIPKNKNYGSGY